MNIHANLLNTTAADSFLDNIRKDVLKITGDALKDSSIHSIASCYACLLYTSPSPRDES
jgi:hypothetical protein